MPDGVGYCGMMEVIDTTHAVINGHALLQVTCAYLDDVGAVTSNGFSFTERLGTGSMHFPYGGCFVVEGWWGGHTYPDNEFPLYDNGSGSNCDHFSGIASHGSEMILNLYPNPGTDVLHIESGLKGPTELRVLDTTGRNLLKATNANGSLSLGCADLLPGVYLVEVRNRADQRTQHCVKQ